MIWSSIIDRVRRRHRDIGAYGERLAARHLRRRGMRIIDRNRRLGHDEIDLLACTRDGTIVIVEVKTRRQARHPIETAVTPAKRYRLDRAARRLMMDETFSSRAMRFDVVTVDLAGRRPSVNHIVNAFDSMESHRYPTPRSPR